MEETDKSHASTALSPEQEAAYQLNRRLVGPHSRSERFGEEKNLLLLPGLERRIIQPAAWSLYRLRYGGDST